MNTIEKEKAKELAMTHYDRNAYSVEFVQGFLKGFDVGWEALTVENVTLKEQIGSRNWVLVNERLPDEIGDYIVTEQSTVRYTYTVYIKNGRWWCDYTDYRSSPNDSGSVLDDFTAWMPLPEPYKVGK